jgi:uncharacterized membrane protein YccC
MSAERTLGLRDSTVRIWKAMRRELTLSSPVFRLSAKAALAVSLGVVMAKLLGLSHEIWLVVSVIVVMKPTLGGALRFGLDRVLGTLGGALIAIAYLWLFGAHGPSFWPVLIFGAGTAIYLNAFRYRVFVGVLTFALVLAFARFLPEGWLAGLYRVYATLGGVAIGLLAQRFVWPTRARKRVREKTVRTLEALAGHAQALCETGLYGPTGDALPFTRREAFLTLGEFSATLEEARSEPGLNSVWRKIMERLKSRLEHIYYLQVSMDTVVRDTDQQGAMRLVSSQLSQAETVLLDAYSELTENVRNLTTPQPRTRAHAVLDDALARLHRARERGELEPYATDELLNISALLWHYRTLDQELADLEAVVAELADGVHETMPF